jgi:CPA2 family monovalent cation:H+ antiporter-2
VVGVEKQDGELHAPDVSAAFEEGDVVWVVGEKNDVKKLL